MAPGWPRRGLRPADFLITFPLLLNSTQTSLSGAGFIGTLVGVFTVRWLARERTVACVIVLTGAFMFSVAVSDYAEQQLRRIDDPRIIIDEWVGLLVGDGAFCRRRGSIFARGLHSVSYPGCMETLRAYGESRSLPGGWGVVLDDIAAGFAVANLHGPRRRGDSFRVFSLDLTPRMPRIALFTKKVPTCCSMRKTR